MRLVWLAPVLLTGFVPQTPGTGLAIREAGCGFHARSTVPNLTLRADTPLDAVYVGRVDTWVPFRAVLENRGRALEGTLILKEAFESRIGVVYRKRLTLPERGQKSVSFPILYRVGCPLSLTFVDDRLGSVALGDSKSLDLPPPQSVGPTPFLVLVASGSRGSFTHFLRRGEEGRLSQDRFIIPIRPADLPDNAIEYQGVDVLVLDDLPLDSLSDEQQAAIRMFVARGGLLAVSLLRNSNRIAGTQLEAILPGKPDGLSNVARVEALDKASGKPCLLESPLAMTSFAPVAAGMSWDDSRTVLHRSYERGRVLLLGFPLSATFLESWPGASRLMDSMVDSAVREPIPMPGGEPTRDLRHPIAVALKESMVRPIPSFKTILALMLCYGVAIVFLPYLLFHRLRRLEWSWSLIFVIAIIGSGTVFAVGRKYVIGVSTAFRVSLLEGGGAEGPRIRHNFWSVFSSRGEKLDVAFEEPSAIPFPLGRELALRGASSSTEPMSVSYDETRLVGLKTYTQDSSLFETTDVQLLPGRLSCTASLAVATLRADPSFPLLRAWYVEGEKVREFPRLARGTTEVILSAQSKEPASADPQDALMQNAVSAMIHLTCEESAAREKPMLLYLYEGAPSLKNAGISERGLDFGWLEVEPANKSTLMAKWIPRQEPAASEYTIVLSRLSPDDRIAYIRNPNWAYGGTMEIYDHRADSWHRFADTVIYDPENFIRYSPLGAAYARLRFRSHGRTDSWVGEINVVSKIERRTP